MIDKNGIQNNILDMMTMISPKHPSLDLLKSLKPLQTAWSALIGSVQKHFGGGGWVFVILDVETF